jgi:hypothetical protein
MEGPVSFRKTRTGETCCCSTNISMATRAPGSAPASNGLDRGDRSRHAFICHEHGRRSAQTRPESRGRRNGIGVGTSVNAPAMSSMGVT